jgi:hypothetical protein
MQLQPGRRIQGDVPGPDPARASPTNGCRAGARLSGAAGAVCLASARSATRRAAAPRARAYIEELLPDILEGRIEPGKVFDRNIGLDGVPDGYRAMADRESIKVMVTP